MLIMSISFSAQRFSLLRSIRANIRKLYTACTVVKILGWNEQRAIPEHVRYEGCTWSHIRAPRENRRSSCIYGTRVNVSSRSRIWIQIERETEKRGIRIVGRRENFLFRRAVLPRRVKSFCHNGDKSDPLSPSVAFSSVFPERCYVDATLARTPPQLRCLCKGVVSSRLIRGRIFSAARICTRDIYVNRAAGYTALKIGRFGLMVSDDLIKSDTIVNHTKREDCNL